MATILRVFTIHLLSIAALAAIMITARTSQAQRSSDTPRPVAASATAQLQLGDLYAIAARTNPRVEAGKALARAANARVPSARRPPDPQLQLGFMNRSLPSLAPMVPLGMTQIQVMQMVPTPGKLSLAGRVASAQATAASARADDIRWDVRSRIAMAFYDLYRIHGSLQIAQETKRLVQDIARTAQVMYSVGDGKQADVLRAQVAVARMTEEITRMESMRAAMSGRLAAVLDVPADATVRVPRLPQMPDVLPPIEELIEIAEANRPMIVAGIRELDGAVAGQRLARREIWPDLQVGLQYGQNRGPMGTERMASLMLGATVPVFARSRQLRMREEADAMRLMAVADLAVMRADTRGRMTELYADFVRARTLRALYRTTVIPQAQGAVTASFAAYRVGELNFMTLLDNQMTVNSYRQEVFGLEGEQGKAIAEMEMLLGRALFDPGAAVIAEAGTRR